MPNIILLGLCALAGFLLGYSIVKGAKGSITAALGAIVTEVCAFALGIGTVIIMIFVDSPSDRTILLRVSVVALTYASSIRFFISRI